MMPAMSILGGLSPAKFLRDHWQKRPLLVRQALPGFAGIIDRDDFLALATRPDVESRLVIHHPRARSPEQRWSRHDGPFGALDARMLPARAWTLLIHRLESLVPGGWELLRAFSFIPAARVDDLMVSYAAEGGSVGPHDDVYDVFLLQGPGRRRWQVSTGGSRALDARARIKVLKSFRPDHEWVLEPGDMLYLPPGVAHHGVAEGGPCFTYSIGFVAPSHADLVRAFYEYLGHTRSERIDPSFRYADPGLVLQRDPLAIGDAMVEQVESVVEGLAWNRAEVAEFIGRYLTLPRVRAAFPAPARPLAPAAFARKLRRRGRLKLSLASRGLVRGGRLYLNGHGHAPGRPSLPLLRQLLWERALPLPLPPSSAGAATIRLLHQWHEAGYLTFG
jgi:50S ribosomal protein L16 3-hydroxylase